MTVIGPRDLLKSNSEETLRLGAKHGAWNARIFGSTPGGEAERATDMDSSVETELERSFLKPAGPWQDLFKNSWGARLM